jgi:hypothetical protein
MGFDVFMGLWDKPYGLWDKPYGLCDKLVSLWESDKLES